MKGWVGVDIEKMPKKRSVPGALFKQIETTQL